VWLQGNKGTVQEQETLGALLRAEEIEVVNLDS
jgi:hypothetical protein